MYICICNRVTDSQIRECVETHGVRTVGQLRKRLGTCAQCGKCALATKQVLDRCLLERHCVSASLDLESAGALNYG
ncbi:MAG: (2Fe-2S)-binding protein [Methylococcaceae bacterium]|nr:(2Fe-2S)-binding protein [Methylococcaceae bacterium]MCI0668152.1 (2Fe-2S)-binding protein [Methylococcaceae bacterium]MCI0732670.1 (2Fe-2S)-binding protein [Methylococcaceae bacterium]